MMSEEEIRKFHTQVLLKLQEGIELATMLGEEAKVNEFKAEFEKVQSDNKYFRDRYLSK
jgi:hypothetical protein